MDLAAHTSSGSASLAIMLHDLRLGLSGFLRAFGFALRHGMGWMFIAPTVLFALLVYLFFQAVQGPVNELSAWLASLLELPVGAAEVSLWSDLKAFLNGARELFVLILLKVAVLYVLFKVNKYLVLILLSPMLAYASERTEELLTGRSHPFSMQQLVKDALRGALIALRNGFLELGFTVGIWLATLFVPVLSPISFVLLFLVSAYFYGFSMVDYVFERRRMRIGESVRAVNDRMGIVLANGALFSLLMKLPFLGVMFAPAMAAIGASIAMVEDRAREQVVQR
jgi:CysZ protein